MQTKTAGPRRDDREPLELKNPAAPEKKPSGFEDLATSIGSRNLMIIIVTMPLVFVAVVATIISVFGGDDSADATAIRSEPAPIEVLSEPAPVQRSAGVGALSPTPAGIPLSTGAQVAAMALDGDRLAVRVEGPSGAEVVIYDLAAGQVVQRIPIVRGD